MAHLIVGQHSFVMPSEEHLSKVGGIGAIAGVIVLLVATMLHPMGAHPGDAPAAVAEYAMVRHLVATQKTSRIAGADSSQLNSRTSHHVSRL